MFSPDGRSIAYWSSDVSLKQVSVEGGAATVLAPVSENPFGMSWSAHGLVYSVPGGIWRIYPPDRNAVQLVGLGDQDWAQGPQVLPDGRHVLFTMSTGMTPNWERGTIVARSLDDARQVTLIEDGADGRYVASGHLVFFRGGTMLAAPFDVEGLRVTGDQVPVLDGVHRSTAGASGAAHFSISSNGTLVYRPGLGGSAAGRLTLVISDAKGVQQTVTPQPDLYGYPRFSPDGTHVAFQTTSQDEAAVWVQPVDGSLSRYQLTLIGRNRFPIWSHDGRRIIFQSDREGDQGLWSQRADTPGQNAERLTRAAPATSHIPDAWSPDGNHLLITVKSGREYTLHVWSKSDGQLRPFAAVRSLAPLGGTFHPHGDWIAYAATRIGTNDSQMFVEPFPPTGDRSQL